MRLRSLVNVVAAVAVLAFITAMAPQSSDYLPVGSDAPTFEITATNGETYSLAELTEKAPVFIVFWKGSCPHNRRATPHFNAIKEAYGDKATLLGIVKTSPDGARDWAEQFSVNYPMLPDEEGSLVEAYQLAHSICTFLIGTDGKVAKVFGGYGFESMSELNKSMAEVAGVDVADVDLSAAPPRTTWG